MKAAKKRWEIRPPAGGDESLAHALNLSSLTVQLLAARDITAEADARKFLSPDLADLHDPFLLPDMAEAVARIKKAIADGESICVWGDFDVDGITSTVLLRTALARLGANVEHYVPDRMREGYGLNTKAIGEIAKRCGLLVTVDCGIAAVDEIAFAKQQGLDVIVTDHHEPQDVLPEALAVIDPKRLDSDYPFKDLAGVGVAFKLVQALFSEMGDATGIEPAAGADCDGPDWTGYLDLIALGTVADVVPLLGENRVLVAHGLPALLASERVGIRVLLEITALAEKAELGSGQVGFILAPRINAAGRLAKADEAIQLMLTDDRRQAMRIARTIDGRNRERQQVEEKILAEALAMVEAGFDPDRDKSIVLTSDDWHEGVKGIVASRIADMFCRPTFLFSVRDGLARGSARSIAGLDLHSVLCQMSELFTRFGGHAAAAGMSLPVGRMDEFKESLGRLLDDVLTPEDLVPRLRVDAEVAPGEMTHDFADELKRIAPFGMGNPSPVFALKDVYLDGQQRVGAGGDHLKFMVRGPERALEAIAFRLATIDEVEQHFGRANVAFHLERDEWRGAARLQLRVVDLDLGEPRDAFVERLFAEAETIISDEEYKNIGDADCFYTKVVGVTFEGRQDVLSELAADEPVRLEREPDNEYDPNAIRVVDITGKQVGYLAAALAKHLAPVMDDGAAYEAEITEVTGGDEKHLGINLLVRKILGEGDGEEADRREARAEWAALPAEELVDRLADEFLGGGALTDKQREALDALDRGENTLVVMGTGRGKSLIFHTHAARLALVAGKVSIFVYPLRALISDQQQHLDEVFAPVGLRAVTLNGDVTLGGRDTIFSEIEAGEVDVVLTTPEFLHHHMRRFGDVAGRVGFLVVDEAHHICTSSSGHRPLYKRLDETVGALGGPLTLAVTATADDETAAEIRRTLAVRAQIVDRSVRENLAIVDKRGGKGKDEHVAGIAARGEKTIVYVNSREQSVRLAEKLRRRSDDRSGAVVYYNAGLNKEMRRAIETRFRSGATSIVVATSAFGEGINIPDVRNVILYHMPLSAIEYNQQSGRVGRDGEPALIHLLFGPDEVRLNRRLLESYSPSRTALVELYKLIRDLDATDGPTDGATDDRAGFIATNDDLADMIKKRVAKTPAAKVSIGPRGVSSGLRIFEELGLVRLEGSGRYRRIILEPSPEKKLSLADSVRYQEGSDEKDAFDEFAGWALEAKVSELLTAVNRPICPVEVSDELRAAFGDVTPVTASAQDAPNVPQ